jgi:hypothetical protein
MAVASERKSTIAFTGDLEAQFNFYAADNAASPAQIDVVTLASGPNTITPPSSGTTPKALTILPPAGNTVLITLKGVTGDTGVPLHKTDPTSIGVDSTLTTLVLTAAAEIAGVRLVWS